MPRTCADRSSPTPDENAGVDHLADVVVELDQVDKNRPLNFQEKILLVVLKLGMKPVNHPLARRLGPELPFKSRLEQVKPSAQVLAQSLDGIQYDRGFDSRVTRLTVRGGAGLRRAPLPPSLRSRPGPAHRRVAAC